MEFEVKWALQSHGQLEEILWDVEIQQAQTERREIPMETTYYDAPDGSLSAKKWTVRRRLEGGTSVVTVKTPGAAPNTRGEWETEAEAVLPALPVLASQGAPEGLLSVQALEKVCGARFHRTAVRLALEGCEAELALDEGILFREDRTLPFLELELELKAGDPAPMLALGDRLQRRYGLSLEKKSKFYRAFHL